MDDEHLDGDSPDAHVIADGQTAETFGLMAELQSPGAARVFSVRTKCLRSQLDAVFAKLGDPVVFPATSITL